MDTNCKSHTEYGRHKSDSLCPLAENEITHTPTPWKVGSTMDGSFPITAKINGVEARIAEAFPEDWPETKHNAAYIVRAVNSHEELLEAAKNARNVLAGLVTGDLQKIKADSPALIALRLAIAKAEGK